MTLKLPFWKGDIFMDKNNFEVGLISEQDLVTRYGSQSQKDSYEKLGYMQT